MKELPDKANLTAQEVADFFRIERRTAYYWVEKGLLKRSTPKGCALRIPRDSVIFLARAINKGKQEK